MIPFPNHPISVVCSKPISHNVEIEIPRSSVQQIDSVEGRIVEVGSPAMRPKVSDVNLRRIPTKPQLKLPDVPVVAEARDPVAKSVERQPRPSLAEDVKIGRAHV